MPIPPLFVLTKFENFINDIKIIETEKNIVDDTGLDKKQKLALMKQKKKLDSKNVIKEAEIKL